RVPPRAGLLDLAWLRGQWIRHHRRSFLPFTDLAGLQYPARKHLVPFLITFLPRITATGAVPRQEAPRPGRGLTLYPPPYVFLGAPMQDRTDNSCRSFRRLGVPRPNCSNWNISHQSQGPRTVPY